MVPAKETAEEQLLRMIEGPSRPKRREAPKGSSIQRGLNRFRNDWSDLWNRLTLTRGRRDRTDNFLWQLQLAGRVFWVMIGSLAVYIVVDLWVLQPQPPALVTSSTVIPQLVDGGTSSGSLEDNLKASAEAYRKTLSSRNPFRLAKERFSETAVPVGPTAKTKLLELTSNLVVVGINRGRIPEALIEDTEAKRTHFVKVGDEINGVIISEISNSGVVVTYEGEETILQ